jgi:hypothetical protein
MECCTKQEVWDIEVGRIKMERGELLVSIIENLICDAVAEESGSGVIWVIQ